jgi:hypothetical protein
MAFLSFPQNSPFDPVTGELLPNYRDAYLHGQLSPTVALKVERYLANHPIQTSMLLGRYHELAAAARRRNRTITPPLWVQYQLTLQPTVSKVGPFRRPAVRVALGLLTGLTLVSALQWMRNESLTSDRVAAVAHIATSTAHATEQLARQSPVPLPDKVKPRPKPVAARLLASLKPKQYLAPTAANVRARAAALAWLAKHSPAATKKWQAPASRVGLPVASRTGARPRPAAQVASPQRVDPDSGLVASSAEPAAPALTTVRGHISDANGRPLVGATVLVQGSHEGTSTDATGNYELTVPTGAVLQYGYAGYVDLLSNPNDGLADVVLHQNDSSEVRSAISR